MRVARVRPVNRAHYVHCMGRVAGPKDWLPFGDVEKAYMIKLWKRLSSFYTVETISFVAMSNHWHAVVYVPKEPVSCEVAADRHNRYYEGKLAPITPKTEWGREKLETITTNA